MGKLIKCGLAEELEAIIAQVGNHLQFRLFDLEYRYSPTGGVIFTRDLITREVEIKGNRDNSQFMVTTKTDGPSADFLFQYFAPSHEIAKFIIQLFVVSPKEAEPLYELLN